MFEQHDFVFSEVELRKQRVPNGCLMLVSAHHCPALKLKSGWTAILKRFTVSDSFMMPHTSAGYRTCVRPPVKHSTNTQHTHTGKESLGVC